MPRSSDDCASRRDRLPRLMYAPRKILWRPPTWAPKPPPFIDRPQRLQYDAIRTAIAQRITACCLRVQFSAIHHALRVHKDLARRPRGTSYCATSRISRTSSSTRAGSAPRADKKCAPPPMKVKSQTMEVQNFPPNFGWDRIRPEKADGGAGGIHTRRLSD